MAHLNASLLLVSAPLAAFVLFGSHEATQSPSGTARVARGEALSVHLDIKPGSCPNPVNVGHPGADFLEVDGCLIEVLPVSVIGNKFDVAQITLGSLAFSRSGLVDGKSVTPIRIEFGDTGTPFVGKQCECHDLEGDGILDLDLKFDKRELIEAFELSEEENGTFIELRLTGLVEGELEFVGKDCIRIVNH